MKVPQTRKRRMSRKMLASRPSKFSRQCKVLAMFGETLTKKRMMMMTVTVMKTLMRVTLPAVMRKKRKPKFP